MSCGKTEELLRRLKRAVIAGKKIKVFSPSLDTRALGNIIQSRNGANSEAIKINNAIEILTHIDKSDEIIAIDELQFFNSEIVEVVRRLIKMNKKVIGTGLDLDFKEEPFGMMPTLLAMADRVDKLTAICMKCGSEYAVRTQRLIDGQPADKSSPLIMIGGDETYEARCIDCYELPDKNSELKKSHQNVAKDAIKHFLLN